MGIDGAAAEEMILEVKLDFGSLAFEHLENFDSFCSHLGIGDDVRYSNISTKRTNDCPSIL